MHNWPCTRQSSGFSVTELLISIAIMSVITSGALLALDFFYDRFHKMQLATDMRIEIRTLEHDLISASTRAIAGRNYFNNTLATQLGVGWLQPGSGVRGSLIQVNRGLVGLATVDPLDDGATAALTPDYQTLVFLSRDQAVTELNVIDKSAAEAIYSFADDTDTGTLNVAGSVNGYGPGDVIALCAGEGNLFLKLVAVVPGRITFQTTEEFDVGLYFTKMPISMIVPGTRVLRVKAVAFGYEIETQTLGLVSVTPDGAFASKFTTSIPLGNLALTAGFASNFPYTPLLKSTFLQGRLTFKTINGQTREQAWELAL